MAVSRHIVIGDIHGSATALRRVLQQIGPQAADTLIFLGDYIDRGEDSRAVLDQLMALDRAHSCIFLKGNHEDLFLRAYEGDGDEWLAWLVNGGITTLRDFGQTLPPEPYIAWLRRLRLTYEIDGYLFVHAGLRPGMPPEATTDEERLWIREPFLSSSYDWGKRVVFGHTVQPRGPLVQPNKIGIDTGAYLPRMGKLTGLILPDKRFAFSMGRSRSFT
jgi:serine/threonine protein phosphatase 1